MGDSMLASSEETSIIGEGSYIRDDIDLWQFFPKVRRPSNGADLEGVQAIVIQHLTNHDSEDEDDGGDETVKLTKALVELARACERKGPLGKGGLGIVQQYARLAVRTRKNVENSKDVSWKTGLHNVLNTTRIVSKYDENRTPNYQRLAPTSNPKKPRRTTPGPTCAGAHFSRLPPTPQSPSPPDTINIEPRIVGAHRRPSRASKSFPISVSGECAKLSEQNARGKRKADEATDAGEPDFKRFKGPKGARLPAISLDTAIAELVNSTPEVVKTCPEKDKSDIRKEFELLNRVPPTDQQLRRMLVYREREFMADLEKKAKYLLLHIIKYTLISQVPVATLTKLQRVKQCVKQCAQRPIIAISTVVIAAVGLWLVGAITTQANNMAGK